MLTLSVAAAQDKGGDKSDTPAEQYKALLNEYQDASGEGAASDEERMKFVGRVYKLRYKLAMRFLELAERSPKDPIALARLDPGGLAGEHHRRAGAIRKESTEKSGRRLPVKNTPPRWTNR